MSEIDHKEKLKDFLKNKIIIREIKSDKIDSFESEDNSIRVVLREQLTELQKQCITLVKSYIESIEDYRTLLVLADMISNQIV